MKYPLLRRLRLSGLDRQVARASMQICHKIVMQQLYISRLDVNKQWLVISNPSERSVDLTGFTVSSSDGSEIFHFPKNYILLSGDEVTIWCSPGSIDLDTDNLLHPYLFWTRPNGTLRHAPFFTKGVTNDVLLLDPFMIEVASLQVSELGKQEFRVLHCVSMHKQTRRAARDGKFCVGCLSPPESYKTTTPNGVTSGRDVYVFSRYWDVVSHKSYVAHFLAIVLAPLLEIVRALLIYLLLAIFQQLKRDGAGISSPLLGVKIMRIIAVMMLCDVLARRVSLWIKSGLLVSVLSFMSVILDQLAITAVYTALEWLYPPLGPSFHALLQFELGLSCISMAGIHFGFVELRHTWPPIFKELMRWDYQWQSRMVTCALARELLLYLLLVLPLLERPVSPWWSILGYALVPFYTFAIGMDFVRGVATLLHLVQYPFLVAKTRHLASRAR